MKTQVQPVKLSMGPRLEYALPRGRGSEGRGRQEPGIDRGKLREMLTAMAREAVQRQMKEQQEYYRSRPSLAARQMEQIFGAGSMERALTPAISIQVYEQLEDRIRREWIRKGG